MLVDAQGKEVFIVQMKGKSFALDLMQEEQAAIHKEESNTMHWHRRLGHFHHTALPFMKKNYLREGLLELEVKPPICVASYMCSLLVRETNKTPFPTKQGLEGYSKVTVNTH